MMKEVKLDGRTPYIVVGIVALLVRLYFFAWPFTRIDEYFVPDDTYYTLTIARSLAHGLGPSASAGVLTNGFQPLIAFLIVPFALLGMDGEALVRVAIFIGVLSGVGTSIALVAACKALTDDARVRVLAGLGWALSPVAVSLDLCGLETTLAVFLSLLALLLTPDVDDKAKRWLAWGGVLGCALLARVDTCFLVGALGLERIVRGKKVRGVALAAVSAALVVFPWWAYSTWTFGTPVPESGAAVRALTADHQQLYLTVQRQMGWAAGHLLPGLVGDSPALRAFTFSEGTWSMLLWALPVVLLLVGREYLALRGASLALVLFYTFFVPALWFFQRYFALALVGLWLSGLSLLPSRARIPTLVTALALCAWGLSSLAKPVWLHGARGYAAPAREIVAKLPADATLGALQSGALAYFAPPTMRVLNLDGVIDRRSAEAIKTKTLSTHILRQGVDYIADWEFNLKAIARFSTHGRELRARQAFVSEHPQGDDRFVVVRVER